ncbi:MAG: DedA family protein [Propioniciclava sp.]
MDSAEQTPDEQRPAEAETADQEWWSDPSLPWRHQPTRADIACLSALGIVGVYGLVMLPLRPVMLGLAPHLLGSLGYRTGVVLVGALAAVGDLWWPLVLVLGSLMSAKFDWIYWWAGRLWGRGIMDVWIAQRGAATQRRWERVWDLTHRYGSVGIILTFLPIPIPAGVVYVAVGAAGMSLRRFLLVDLASALVSTAGYLALGYALGEPAVAVVDTYGRYLWYVSIAILVAMLLAYGWRQRRPGAGPSGAGKSGAGDDAHVEG